MSIHVTLNHLTRYRYDRPVRLSPQIIRLRPAPHARSPILSYSLRVEPRPHFLNWQQDPHSNWLARVVFPDAVRELAVTVDMLVDFVAFNAFDFFVEEYAERWPFAYEPALAEDLKPFRRVGARTPRLGALLDAVPRSATNTVGFLVDFNRELERRLDYVIRLEPGVQTPEETLAKESGSCRDSGWLLVEALRHLGFAARFVSGYLIQLAPDVKSLDGPSGAESDFTDLHAWAEVYLPGAGWVGLDPTSGLLAGEGHVPLCATPEPQSAAPISGEVEECQVEFSHHMTVRRVFEAPRVTRPYGEAAWAEIDALGEAVDERLRQGDVRLTMGGEPTFVAIDDMESEEWNTAAVGPTKLARAEALVERLRRRFAPGGLVTAGQGKWYPGESLPRWATTLHWLEDGQPLWRIASPDRDVPPSPALAERFARALARRLGVEPRHALPAYEDPFYYLHREGALPVDVDPRDPKLDDPEERARLARVFGAGLGAARGWVLPVQPWQGAARRWASEEWRFRGGRLLLIPGDSPIGFRLPLESLPWLPPGERPRLFPADPTVPRPPLGDPRRQPHLQSRRAERAPGEADATDERPEGPAIRTAIAIEPRDAELGVFFPPLPAAEDYVDLLAAVEDVAAELRAPVRVEGYPPPHDPRLRHVQITPDPGVLEVNVHPARSWRELRDTTVALYEEARLARLGTEKFLIDGRAVGTGGGNHVVLGGATPLDSPFLRRPDLLGSLLRYWQNHPSLSYLFSGLFLGPTSQHPRIDEARDSQLYEVELALSELPPRGRDAPPWLVDRILRNLLVDLTGNTHRTEFCIDKLYAPETAQGRRGLVEIRSFEMPPHARMSLAEQLLVRALVCRFWEEPYGRPLVRFGTTLHDRFLLPHFVREDFAEVIEDLRAAGFPFRPEWYAPHFEFRFPRHGAVTVRGVEIELRQALEPWPVLGEEAGAGGTSRYVDSSLERLQVRVTELHGERWWVTCNGRALPLVSTGRRGEWVAGVRYRAWQPWSALHPTIPAHTPLVFDLYDRWNGRALGGCTYHVAHPAGRNYETFPVNALEAESRRLSRFEPRGHTPGPYEADAPRVDPEYPATLDLRWSVACR